MNTSLLYLSLPLVGALVSLIVVATKPSPALHARRWLVLSMLCGALSSLLLAHYYIPELRESILLDLFCDAALLGLAPCLYMCVRRLTSLHEPEWQDLWVFIPGGALWLLVVVLCLVMGMEETRSALAEIVLRIRPVSEGHGVAYRMYAFFGHSFFRSFVILTLMGVLGWGAYAIRRYSRSLDDYLANNPTTPKDFALLYLSFVLMTCGGMVLAACEYSQTFVPWILPLFSATEALSMLLMGYFARKVVYSAEQLVALRLEHDTEPEPEPIENSLLPQPDSAVDPMRERLERVKAERLYRDPNLTIFSLSRILCTNRTYLTRAFRQVYGCSFAEYVNGLRVAEAHDLIESRPSLPLHEIANIVGYNSATSLYRNYVKIYKHAPKKDK